MTVTCGTEVDGDVFEDGAVTHIRFTVGSSHLLLRQKACAALGMADRVGLRMEYLGPDERWFALVDSDDMDDAVEFARHPGPPQAASHESQLEPEPEPEPERQSEPSEPPSEPPSRVAVRGSQARNPKKLAIRLVMPGELVHQQIHGAAVMPGADRPGATPAFDQGARFASPRGLPASAANAVVLEATVHGWHAEDVHSAAAPGSVPSPQ